MCESGGRLQANRHCCLNFDLDILCEMEDEGRTCFKLSEWKAFGSWTLEVKLNAILF